MDQVENVLRVAIASGRAAAEHSIDRVVGGAVAAGEGDRHRDFTTKFRAYMVHMVLVVTESPVSVTFEAFSRMQTVGFISSDLRVRTTLGMAQDLRRIGRRSDAVDILGPVRDLLLRDGRLSRLRRWYLADIDSLVSTLEAEVEQTSRGRAE